MKYKNIFLIITILCGTALIAVVFTFSAHRNLYHKIKTSFVRQEKALRIKAPVLLPEITSSTPRLAALTFDDGPYGRPTEDILNILEKNNIKATFFLVGQNVIKYPELVQKEFAAGHVIGNHTWDHSKTLFAEPTDTIVLNIKKTDDAVEKIIHQRPHFFRPPYGYVGSALKEAVTSTGHILVMWNVAPHDYDKNCDADCIVATVLEQAKGHRKIDLDLHDGRDVLVDYPRDNIIAALPKIISELKKQGYEFVTLDQLLQEKAYQ